MHFEGVVFANTSWKIRLWRQRSYVRPPMTRFLDKSNPFPAWCGGTHWLLIAYACSNGTTIRKQLRAIDESRPAELTEHAPDYSTNTTPTLTSFLCGLGSKRTT